MKYKGGDIMWEKIKKQFEGLFVTKFVIVRNKLIPWQTIYANRVETRVVLGKGNFLSKDTRLNDYRFTEQSSNLYLANGLWSYVLMKILIRRFGNDHKFKRLKAKEIVFMNEVQGLRKDKII